MANNSKNKDLMSYNFRFFWVVALRSEAHPLIKMLNLKFYSNHSMLPIYINRENGHALVISGIGSIKSAVAAMYLRSTFEAEQFAAWINIGIAGHPEGPVGNLFQAIKVINEDNKKSFFPGLRFPKVATGTELRTVSLPESQFTHSALYDMEAAGFCEIVPNFSCNELTFVLKIVSDTSKELYSAITKKMVAEIFEENAVKINNLLDGISKFVNQEKRRLETPPEINEIISLMHFTETNRIRFEKIYKKWCCVFPNDSLIEKAQKVSLAKDLIKKMELDIAAAAESWDLK